MSLKISSAIYDSSIPATKQLFEGESGNNVFYGRNGINWVAFTNASLVTDAAFEVANISTGDIFVLNGIDPTIVKAKLVGNSVVLTVGSQTYTFGALAGGESFTIKFANADGSIIDAKELVIARTANNSGLEVTSTYGVVSGGQDSPIPLGSGDLFVAPLIPQFSLKIDSGVNSGDGISNDDTIFVSGLKIANGATWQYTLDGGSTWLPFPANSVTATGGEFHLETEKTYEIGSIKVTQTYNGVTTISDANISAITFDKTAPVIATSNPITAITDKITLVFSELVSTSLAIGDILVNNAHSLGNSTMMAINAVDDYATSFEITRDPAATLVTGDTLTVAATKAVDKAGNTSVAITFTVPTLPDILPPTMSSAMIDSTGLSVVITYSEALSGTPEVGDYVITLGSGTTTVSTAVINGNAVLLTLANPIGVGVTVSEIVYTASNGTADSIKDVATNSAITQNLFTANITNNSTADITAPVLSTATVNGATLVLTYGEALDATNAPVIGDFAVTVAGINSLVVSGSTVTLALASAVTEGQTVTIDYVQATDITKRIQDAAGNDSLALTTQTVANATIAADTTPPTFASAAVNDTSLVLTYDEALNSTLPIAGAFTLSGTSATISSVALGSDTKTLVLTLNQSVLNTDTVTIAYAVPLSGNILKDVAGNEAPVLLTSSVTNNTLDITPPTATIAQANFYENTNTIMLTGTNFDTLLQPGETHGVTDVKARLDWTKFVWDINNDGNTTADVAFVLGDITSAIVGTNDTELSIVLGSTQTAALYAAAGFNTSASDSTVDGLTIYSGFLRDGASTPNVNQVNTLTLLGSNFANLLTTDEANNGDSIVDAKARIDWTKLTWDTNKDTTATADVTFLDADIGSATLDTNTGKLDIVFTQNKIDALYQATGFNKSSADAITDGLIITNIDANGFFKNSTPAVTSAYLNAFDTALNSTNYDATVSTGGTFNSAIHSTNLSILGGGTFSIVGTNFTASPIFISLKDGSSAIVQANVSALPNGAAVTNGSAALGKMSVDLTGTTGANITLGNGGDTVILSADAQSVSMGSSADILVINKSSATASLESDFVGGGADKIYLSKAIFTLTTTANNQLIDTTDFGNVINYDSTTGELKYDEGGSGAGAGAAAVTILTLTGLPTLSAADFYVIA